MGIFSAGAWRTAQQAVDRFDTSVVAGKTFVVTGGYNGIGIWTCRALLSKGGKVIIGGRNPDFLDQCLQDLKKEYPEQLVDGALIDLADLSSVKKFSEYVQEKCERIDALILNAGVMFTPPSVTENGLEMQVGVNVVGHFLLAKLLVANTVRQVWVSSEAHRILYPCASRFNFEAVRNFQPDQVKKHYSTYYQYQQSKLGNILLAKAFARRYDQLQSISLHPGIIKTDLTRHLDLFSRASMTLAAMLSLVKTPPMGAATSVTCALLSTDSPQWENGGYYSDCQLDRPSRSYVVDEDVDALFQWCDEVTRKFQS